MNPSIKCCLYKPTVFLKKELLRQLRTQRVMANPSTSIPEVMPKSVLLMPYPFMIDHKRGMIEWFQGIGSWPNMWHVKIILVHFGWTEFSLYATGQAKWKWHPYGGRCYYSENHWALPTQLKKSLAWDRGMELAQHKMFTIDTNIKVYFCDPRSPWQRGTSENTDRLLRQYLPKKSIYQFILKINLIWSQKS